MCCFTQVCCTFKNGKVVSAFSVLHENVDSNGNDDLELSWASLK